MEEEPPVNPIWKADYDREPKWKDLDMDDLEMFYKQVNEYLNESGEIDNVDWDRLCFEEFPVEEVKKRIGEGFPEEFYELMSKCSMDDNKIQDYRQLPLNKVEGDIILKMS